MKRRSFLAAMPFALASAYAETKLPSMSPSANVQLKFNRDGRFKILAISDLHFGPEVDPFAVKLIEEMIAKEHPDLVISNGDNVMGGDSKTLAQLQNAVDQVAAAMEKMQVPWAVTMGNHDREHIENTGLPDEDFFALFERKPHNINRGWVRNCSGIGNANFLIWSADGSKPLANLWLLDSGRSLPDDKTLGYEWVRHDQQAWYQNTSQALEKAYGKLPALMFCHIPVQEFSTLIAEKKYIGNKGEGIGSSAINSGLFAAVKERGDVMGIFCGHDHQNNFLGRYRDVVLGFVGVTGVLNAYPFLAEKDPANDRLRGGRVFELHADQPGRFKTWIRNRDGSIHWETWNDA